MPRITRTTGGPRHRAGWRCLDLHRSSQAGSRQCCGSRRYDSREDDAEGAGRPRQDNGQQVCRSDRPHAAGRRLRQPAPPRGADLAHRGPEETACPGAGRPHRASSCRGRNGACEKCRRRGGAGPAGPFGRGWSGKARARPPRIGPHIGRRQKQSRAEHDRRAPCSGSRRDDPCFTQGAGESESTVRACTRPAPVSEDRQGIARRSAARYTGIPEGVRHADTICRRPDCAMPAVRARSTARSPP